jgi:peptidoglycan/LPS O-acetylase OafA/YrhL
VSPADTSQRRLPYQPALDGLRAVAVAGVLLFHAFAASGHSGWFRGGNLGVSVFFTLSGYLITSLLLAEARATGRVRLGLFWTRRIRRLVPASTAVVAGVLVLERLGLLTTRASDVVASLWSVTNWHIIRGGDDELLATVLGPFGPTWSLAVEEQAYVGLALLAWLACRLGRLRLVLATGAAAAVILSLATAWSAGDWSPRVEFGTDARAAEIAIGVLLAVALERSPGLLVRFHRPVAAIGSAAATVLLALFLVADYSPPWLLRGGFVGVACCSVAVIAASLIDTPVRRLLSRKPLVVAGTASYSLYLVHWPVYLVLDTERTGASGTTLVAIRLVAAAAAAALLHLAVEQPMRAATASNRVVVIAWLASAAGLSAVALTALG